MAWTQTFSWLSIRRMEAGLSIAPSGPRRVLVWLQARKHETFL
jgi:hypothetical protein